MKSKLTPILSRSILMSGIILILGSFLIGVGSSLAPSVSLAASTAATCPPTDNDFFGLVPWYEYLKSDFSSVNGACGFHKSFNEVCTTVGPLQITATSSYKCTASDVTNQKVVGVSSSGLDIVWKVGLAIFEDLLRIAGMVAVIFVIYGGVRYLTSQGEPEATKGALSTIINAFIGLAIVLIAAGTVSFIANSLN